MKRWSKAPAAVVVGALFLALASISQAGIGPKWTDEQLAAFSDAIVSGRVVDLKTGWDPDVNTIYTYVTIDVSEVFKGDLSIGLLTIKQIGGVVGELGLSIVDQASFERGEDVLLFLEARPRDRSLYTAALWQGKWNLQTTAEGRAAVRQFPESSTFDRLSLDSVRATVRTADVRRDTGALNTRPVDAVSATPQPFVFVSMPYRYSFNPPVLVHSGGQPGLAGGGFAEIQASTNRWNAAGSSFAFGSVGTTAAARCTTEFLNNSVVTISFMDPCGEMSSEGGVLALGGSYFFESGTTVNGQFFRTAIEGFVVNNDGTFALSFLTQSGCFADVQLHELGHVLGLGHTDDSRAIMFASINNNCTSGPNGLGVDDVQGLLFIYPGTGGVTPPGSAPASVSVVVNGTASITVSWSAVTAIVGGSLPSAATSYRLDFRASPTGPVIQAVPATGTSITLAIPAGLTGTFYVSVTALNSAGAGPSSAPVAFTIGGGGPTSPPPAPSSVTATVNGRDVSVTWPGASGATSYFVTATLNGIVVFNQNIGNNTTVAATGVPPGNYTVTVFSVNAAGRSATGATTTFTVP